MCKKFNNLQFKIDPARRRIISYVSNYQGSFVLVCTFIVDFGWPGYQETASRRGSPSATLAKTR